MVCHEVIATDLYFANEKINSMLSMYTGTFWNDL
jgi:hypothetical protein